MTEIKITKKMVYLGDHLADLASSLSDADKMEANIADILSDEMFSTASELYNILQEVVVKAERSETLSR